MNTANPSVFEIILNMLNFVWCWFFMGAVSNMPLFGYLTYKMAKRRRMNVKRQLLLTCFIGLFNPIRIKIFCSHRETQEEYEKRTFIEQTFLQLCEQNSELLEQDKRLVEAYQKLTGSTEKGKKVIIPLHEMELLQSLLEGIIARNK